MHMYNKHIYASYNKSFHIYFTVWLFTHNSGFVHNFFCTQHKIWFCAIYKKIQLSYKQWCNRYQLHTASRPRECLFYLFSYLFIYWSDVRQTFCLSALKLPAYCYVLDLCGSTQPSLIFLLRVCGIWTCLAFILRTAWYEPLIFSVSFINLLLSSLVEFWQRNASCWQHWVFSFN